MSRKLISAAHSLQLVPVYNIIHFGIVHSKVVIRSIGKPDILMIVPGTLKPGDSKNEDVYTKKHTFKLADVSQNKTPGGHTHYRRSSDGYSPYLLSWCT